MMDLPTLPGEIFDIDREGPQPRLYGQRYDGKPPLALAPPPLEEDVTVEATEDGRFWLMFIRDSGDTRGAILVTRKQLETFLKRGGAALEMTR